MTNQDPAPDYVQLEQLVAKIQSELAPGAEIVHNAKLPGRKSGRNRQIDVLVREHIGQYEILIVIECKDYARPVDVKAVEEFHGLFDDVGAQKGVLVCPKGFSAAAKQRAQGLQIDLYSPVDTDLHKWRVRATIPAICEYIEASMAFGISMSAPLPFLLQQDFYRSLEVHSDDDASHGTTLDHAIRKWNEGEFPTEVGVYDRLPVFGEQSVQVDNGYGQLVPVDISVSLDVRKQMYYGQYPIAKISGFKDEIKDAVIANAFEVGLLEPEFVERNWRRLADVSEAPVTPVLRMTGLVGWAAN